MTNSTPPRPTLKNRRQRRTPVASDRRRLMDNDVRIHPLASGSQPHPIDLTLVLSEPQDLPSGVSISPVREPVNAVAAQDLSTTMADGISDPALTQAVMLNWLGQAPVTFHRVYVDITGNVLSALWLSHALSHMQPDSVNDQDIFDFEVNHERCLAETGLNITEQQQCQQALAELGLGRIATTMEPSTSTSNRFHLYMHRFAVMLLQSSAQLSTSIQAATAQADEFKAEMLQTRSTTRAKRRLLKQGNKSAR